jgi:hypothetical protein
VESWSTLVEGCTRRRKIEQVEPHRALTGRTVRAPPYQQESALVKSGSPHLSFERAKSGSRRASIFTAPSWLPIHTRVGNFTLWPGAFSRSQRSIAGGQKAMTSSARSTDKSKRLFSGSILPGRYAGAPLLLERSAVNRGLAGEVIMQTKTMLTACVAVLISVLAAQALA